MRALVTGSRVPIAIEIVRKLGRNGYSVVATDSDRLAAGSRSRHVEDRFQTAPPRFEPDQYVQDIIAGIKARSIEKLIPSYEEVFYLARHREKLEPHVELFFSDFDVLRRLHDKISAHSLGRDLGIPTYPSVIVTTRQELAEAVKEFDQYFARAAYSRGGAILFTNAGPLANAVPIEACKPSPTNPFIVQPYMRGDDICTQSVVHHGRVVAHATYVHPVMLNHSTGTSFVSIDEPETLRIAQQICEATGYHGQLSMDFMRVDGQLYLIECNPRPSFGLSLMSDEMFLDALEDRRRDGITVAPAGVHRKMSLPLVRNIAVKPWRARAEFNALFHGGPDVFFERSDPMPMIYTILGFVPLLWRPIAGTSSDGSNIVDAFAKDMIWNGEDLGSPE